MKIVDNANRTFIQKSNISEDDCIINLKIEHEIFFLKQKQFSSSIRIIAENIQNWVKRKKETVDEKEYLRLLCSYDKWLKKDH